jgi:hypothetical protein
LSQHLWRSGRKSSDVIVIGGGITGAIAVNHFTAAGYESRFRQRNDQPHESTSILPAFLSRQLRPADGHRCKPPAVRGAACACDTIHARAFGFRGREQRAPEENRFLSSHIYRRCDLDMEHADGIPGARLNGLCGVGFEFRFLDIDTATPISLTKSSSSSSKRRQQNSIPLSDLLWIWILWIWIPSRTSY